MRWAEVDQQAIHSPKDYLCTVVSRLAVDHLRSARVLRERYVGAWLPEPLVGGEGPDPGALVALNESLSTAFLLMLESLTPVERAVFLLRQVFGYDYAGIASMLGKSEENCRQIFSRARRKLAGGRPLVEGAPGQADLVQRDAPARAESVVREFISACIDGDVDRVMSMLAPDAVAVADGGGVVHAALNPIRGADRVARYLLGLSRMLPPDGSIRVTTVNGEPGVVYYAGNRPIGVATFHIVQGKIQNAYLVANPEKLRAVPPGAH